LTRRALLGQGEPVPKAAPAKQQASTTAGKDLLEVLRTRFEANAERHKGIPWSEVAGRLQANPSKVKVLQEMESTGGEPDVVGRDAKTKAFLFVDCSAESPAGRRSLCYDQEALQARKENKPKGSAVALAHKIGIQLLDEAQYRRLQELGEFDLKTSSWIQTPAEIRKLGGAVFCDRRYDQVFLYHNGADSYYAARGFRGSLLV
jgi:Protein of unknown function (DUF4256)